MGKIILLPPSYGVDFSRNAMETIPQPPNPPSVERIYHWYIDECLSLIDANAKLSNAENGGWAFVENTNAKLFNKTINRIKFIPAATVIFNLYKSSKWGADGYKIAEIEISSADIDTVKIYSFPNAKIENGEILFISEAGTTSLFYFNSSTGDGFYSKVQSSKTYNAGISLGISIGFYG